MSEQTSRVIADDRKKLEFSPRAGCVLIYQYSKTRCGKWQKFDNILVPREMIDDVIRILSELRGIQEAQ